MIFLFLDQPWHYSCSNALLWLVLSLWPVEAVWLVLNGKTRCRQCCPDTQSCQTIWTEPARRTLLWVHHHEFKRCKLELLDSGTDVLILQRQFECVCAWLFSLRPIRYLLATTIMPEANISFFSFQFNTVNLSGWFYIFFSFSTMECSILNLYFARALIIGSK